MPLIKKMRFLLCFLLLVVLSGCQYDSVFSINYQQVISEDDADYPFADGQIFYPAISGDILAVTYAGKPYDGLVTPKQRIQLETIGAFPDLSKPNAFDRIDHCYRFNKGYLTLEKLYDAYYAGSFSDAGCFTKSESGSEIEKVILEGDTLNKEEQKAVFKKLKVHFIYMFKLDGNTIYPVKFGKGKKSKIGEQFAEWAHSLNKAEKWWYGVLSKRSFKKEGKTGKVKEILYVNVTSTSAYKAFLKDHEDQIHIPGKPFLIGVEPTKSQKEAYAFMKAVEREASRIRKAQQKQKQLALQRARDAAAKKAALAYLAKQQEAKRKQREAAYAVARKRQAIQQKYLKERSRFIYSLDPGDAYYIPGVLSDTHVVVVRTDPPSNRVKVRRVDDGSVIWVDADKLIDRNGTVANDFMRGTAAIAIIACAFGGCEKK